MATKKKTQKKTQKKATAAKKNNPNRVRSHHAPRTAEQFFHAILQKLTLGEIRARQNLRESRDQTDATQQQIAALDHSIGHALSLLEGTEHAATLQATIDNEPYTALYDQEPRDPQERDGESGAV